MHYIKAWADALRSGKYKHSPHSFRDGDRYSVLAIPCLLYAPDVFDDLADECSDLSCFIGLSDDPELPLKTIKRRIGRDGEIALIDMEAGGASMEAIAEYIETNYLTQRKKPTSREAGRIFTL